MDVDGQLRFRCNMELPILTLRPDPVEEFVDAGDTPGVRPVAKAPVKKAKAAAPKLVVPATKEAAAPASTKTTAIKTSSTAGKAEAAAAPPPTAAQPKAAAKPRTKADDAYRAPSSGDANGTPLDSQAGKSQ